MMLDATGSSLRLGKISLKFTFVLLLLAAAAFPAFSVQTPLDENGAYGRHASSGGNVLLNAWKKPQRLFLSRFWPSYYASTPLFGKDEVEDEEEERFSDKNDAEKSENVERTDEAKATTKAANKHVSSLPSRGFSAHDAYAFKQLHLLELGRIGFGAASKSMFEKIRDRPTTLLALIRSGQSRVFGRRR